MYLQIMTCSKKHFVVETALGSRGHVTVPEIVTITFNLKIESRNKTCSIVKNVGRPLEEKKALIFIAKEINMINRLEIYNTYKYLCSSEEQNEENMLQGTQSASGFKSLV